jgi:RNA polymerase sigma-70 factor, ECF subfamily
VLFWACSAKSDRQSSKFLAARVTDASADERLARAVAGDRIALEDLFAELWPTVHKHIAFVLGFGPFVDDAVQEAMLQIHRSLPRFRGEASLATWALKIATRTAIRYARRERRYRPELDVDVSSVAPDDTAAGAELVLLARTLRELHPKKRVAFVLMAILDCSAIEAAEVLGTNANTAASRFRHARAELQHLIESRTAR